MSTENKIGNIDLDEERINFVKGFLAAGWLLQHIGEDTIFYGTGLPDHLELNKNTALGKGNYYVNGKLVGCYFASQQEFEDACKDTGEPIDELAVFEGNQAPPLSVRDFNDEKDTNQFTLDKKTYSVIKVLNDGYFALAGKTDAKGVFSIDIYPSLNLRREILQRGINSTVKKIKEKQTEVNKLLNRIDNLNNQLNDLIPETTVD
jgi:hypothetical protein